MGALGVGMGVGVMIHSLGSKVGSKGKDTECAMAPRACTHIWSCCLGGKSGHGVCAAGNKGPWSLLIGVGVCIGPAYSECGQGPRSASHQEKSADVTRYLYDGTQVGWPAAVASWPV